MNTTISLDTIDEIKKIAQSTDEFGFTILAIVFVAISVGLIFLIYFHKSTSKPQLVVRDSANYIETEGKITKVNKFQYTVTPYLQEKAVKEAQEYARHKYDDVLGKKQANKNEFIKSLTHHPNPEDIKLEKINKVRYDVTYEFSAEESSTPYTGTFSIYEEKDDVAEGKIIDVMYNPAKPTANYTKYNSPIGRY